MAKLRKDEMALWSGWKRAAETVRARVADEIAVETGLSDPDFGVLTRVVEDGGGAMRQNQLAESMGYHRSRLSHHLSRMEQRGLIARRPVSGGVEVVATEAGRESVARARPVHAAAVRRYLLDPLTEAERHALTAMLDRLSSRR